MSLFGAILDLAEDVVEVSISSSGPVAELVYDVAEEVVETVIGEEI